jgi:hypothetical protein
MQHSGPVHDEEELLELLELLELELGHIIGTGIIWHIIFCIALEDAIAWAQQQAKSNPARQLGARLAVIFLLSDAVFVCKRPETRSWF